MAAAVVVICHGSVEHFLANDFRQTTKDSDGVSVRPTATPSHCRSDTFCNDWPSKIKQTSEMH